MQMTVSKWIWLVFALLLASCGGGNAPPDRTPPPPSTPVDQIAATAPPQEIIFVKLEEVRLTDRAEDRTIAIDSVWMIPLNATDDSSPSSMGARFQYIEEGQEVLVTAGNPYRPSTPWFIGTDKADLQSQDFGLWFVVTSSGNAGEVLLDEFTGLLGDTAMLIVAGGLTTVLTTTTPSVPDETATLNIVAARGRDIMGRVRAIGVNLPAFLQTSLKQVAPDLAFEVEKFAVDLLGASDAAVRMGYFGEVFVIFPAQEDYRLNNRIVVETTDGSLALVFSVFEASTVTDINAVVSSGFEEITIPVEPCNPNYVSTVLAGQAAHVAVPRLSLYQDPIDPNAQVIGNLTQGDEVIPIIPYCNMNTQTLWWTVCVDESTCGWIAENDAQTIFIAGGKEK